MYRVQVDARFCATHRLTLPDGQVEPLHGHDWAVTVECAAEQLDAHGMVVDFHLLQTTLRGMLEDLQHRHLNDLPAFSGRNPTAEAVAAWLLTRLHESGMTTASRVEVTEAPGCRASCERPP